MDERDLEARLSRRLHARFDAGGASPALRGRVADIVTHDARPARSGWWRLAGLAAAAVIVVAAIGLVGRYVTPPGVQPSATATPVGSSPAASSRPTSGPTSGPTGTPSATAPVGIVPPVSTTIWTGLDVEPLAGAPAGISTLVTWTGGYLAIAQTDPNVAPTAWLSRDGRAWSELPASTFGLDKTSSGGWPSVMDGTGCPDGSFLVTQDAAGADTLWTSGDGLGWTSSTPTFTGYVHDVTSGPTAALLVTDDGLWRTTDCTTWQHVSPPGPTGSFVDAVAAFGSGFVAGGGVGSIDSGPDIEPLAWWSTDGQHWTRAAVASDPLRGFVDIYPGSRGLLGLAFSIGLTPGGYDLWTSSNGHSWRHEADAVDPLGVQSDGEGAGNPNGIFQGDGSRIIVVGNTTFEGTVPNQVWASADGTHWTRLAIGGTVGATVTDPAAEIEAFLVRDGVLFSGATGTWFGTATP